MSAVPQVSLTDNQKFLLNVGYLAIINGKGPFGSQNKHEAINGFKVRETWADALVGDDVYTGNEWGKVKAKTGDNTMGWALTVTFSRTVLPAGVDHASWNPVRDEIYTSQLPAAPTATGLANTNAWQNLSSVGILVCGPGPEWLPEIKLDAQIIVKQGVTPTIVNTNVPTVSVQLKVNKVNVGAPVVADAGGIAAVPNAATAGQKVGFVVTKVGYQTAYFGPYTVQP
jgi:hypothetical protein